jgi:hypothetical protein
VLLDILSRVGPETVERLVYAWHGPPQHSAETVERSAEAPPPLARFSEVARRWPQLIVQNRLVDPPERQGKRLLFYVESQGLSSWTTGAGEDDPPVWVDSEGDSTMEEEPLSRFLVTVAILESVFGSPEGASAAWLHRDRLAGGLGPLRRLPFAAWRGFPDGATFYASDELLAVAAINATPESDEYLSVWVGARDREALSALDSVIDESWEYDSRES